MMGNCCAMEQHPDLILPNSFYLTLKAFRVTTNILGPVSQFRKILIACVISRTKMSKEAVSRAFL